MHEQVGTRVAVRVMGVWVRRADALLQDGAVANAARAVQDQDARANEQAAALAAVAQALRGVATRAVGYC